MPVSWIIAVVTVYCLLLILSKISGSSITALLQTETLWPLAVFLPGLLFGKTLGLVTLNLLAYTIPPLRRIFEAEVAETGRHRFSEAMKGLARALAVLGTITFIGAFLFLRYR